MILDVVLSSLLTPPPKYNNCILGICTNHCWEMFKGTLTRDFLPLVFLHQTTSPGPLIHGLIWPRISEDNLQRLLHNSVNDYYYAYHNGINDTAVHVTAVSMTPLCKCACHSSVNDTTLHVTTVSMTPLCISQQCHCHCCAANIFDTLFFIRKSDSAHQYH
jgi:hypothetical protein